MTHNEQIHQLRKEVGIKTKDLARYFELDLNSFRASSAKKRYERALIAFLKDVRKAEREED